MGSNPDYNNFQVSIKARFKTRLIVYNNDDIEIDIFSQHPFLLLVSLATFRIPGFESRQDIRKQKKVIAMLL
jgi:hypothetical protein